MRSRVFALFFILFLPAPFLAQAANRSSYSWDTIKAVDADTVFFGEPAAEKMEASDDAPLPSEKRYPWYCLERGNDHFLNREYEQAVIYFKAAYAVPGPTRVLSGFHLIDAYNKLDWADSALEVLDEMEKKFLVSTREFREARHLRQALEDKRRKGLVHRALEPFTGRVWLKQLSQWRLHWVLGAMDEMRRHGVPLKEEAQGYVFLLEEYFIAHPQEPAQDAVAAFSGFLYERDPDARLAIDRWRMNPEGTVTEEAKVMDKKENKLTGAEWITMVHEDKLEYVAGAMAALKDQRVPMEKDTYAYADALDGLFTEKPELPASDSVAALASLLHETEPKAREILDALRLK